jgi:hypothetical protein
MNQEPTIKPEPNVPKAYNLTTSITTLKSILGVKSVDIDNLPLDEDGISIPLVAEGSIPMTADINPDGTGKVQYGDCYCTIDLNNPSNTRNNINQLRASEYKTLSQFTAGVIDQIQELNPDYDASSIQFFMEDNLMTAYFELGSDYVVDLLYTQYISEPRISMVITNLNDGTIEEYSGNKMSDVLSYI